MKNELGEIRRSSVIQTFGPGAIVDFRTPGGLVSAINCGLDEWLESAPEVGSLENQKVFERRLMSQLGKSYFRLAPVIATETKHFNEQGILVARRFPEWLQCPKCSKLRTANDWMMKPGDAARYCASCSESAPGKTLVSVIPSRFVMACTAGHLQEFPWHWWVKHTKLDCKDNSQLRLEAEKIGLEGLVLSCLNCDAKRSLGDIFNKSALNGMKCFGTRPWMRTNDSACEAKGEDGNLRVLQRAGSNVYYPVIASALDIPPWTSKLMSIVSSYWDDIAACDPADRERWILNTPLLLSKLEHAKVTAAEFVKSFNLAEKSLNSTEENSLKLDEFNVFVSNLKENDKEFALEPESIPTSFAQRVSRLSRVPRLKEIRVLKGFTRISPPFEGEEQDISPISETELPWLPAMEVRGEGIFVSFDFSEIERWSNLPVVKNRYAATSLAFTNRLKTPNTSESALDRTTPVFFFVHSFAHLLMDRLTLKSGYGSASLRERLYVSTEKEMAGVLIYTGTPDSDGTLGGLQAQGKTGEFEELIHSVIAAATWCPSDPVCMHGELTNASSFSIASCHSCIQAPETSCEFNNMFLDRCAVAGDGGEFIGFLGGLDG